MGPHPTGGGGASVAEPLLFVSFGQCGRWEALRYAELNPVRAGLAERPSDWPWSSARAHLMGGDSAGVLAWDEWRDSWSAESWRVALEIGMEDGRRLDLLRKFTTSGRPFGSEEFLREAERRLGRRLEAGKPGPKA